MSASDNMADVEVVKELDVIINLFYYDSDIKLQVLASGSLTWPDPLENDEENLTLSEIANRIEKVYRNSCKDMFGQFTDFLLFDDISRNIYGDFAMDMSMNTEGEANDLPPP